MLRMGDWTEIKCLRLGNVNTLDVGLGTETVEV
jgi:hypothetical protein